MATREARNSLSGENTTEALSKISFRLLTVYPLGISATMLS